MAQTYLINFITDELSLTFVLTCNILLQTAPTDAECDPLKAGRKRRQAKETNVAQTVSSGLLHAFDLIIFKKYKLRIHA